MNHREQFWRWLIFGFRRLMLMVEEHATEVDPEPEQLQLLEEYAERLLAVVRNGQARTKTRSGD